ncbi:hypothetical protein [Dyella sp. C11]|uniref:hypothetical protein n=1 Tax=Dyella sp. C11 TaxID=2126991 RepID=UPI00130073F7|nr:hypothetical protein [Dyella sp. C11]
MAKSLTNFRSTGVIVVGALLIAGAVFAVWSAHQYKKHANASMASSSEERHQDDAYVRSEEAVRRATLGNIALRQAQTNPDSYTLDHASIMEDGVVCYAYHARNASGSMDAGTAVLSAGNELIRADMAEEKAAWEKSCASKTGTDVTASVEPH